MKHVEHEKIIENHLKPPSSGFSQPSGRQVGLEKVGINGQILPIFIIDILLQISQISCNPSQAFQNLGTCARFVAHPWTCKSCSTGFGCFWPCSSKTTRNLDVQHRVQHIPMTLFFSGSFSQLYYPFNGMSRSSRSPADAMARIWALVSKQPSHRP